MNYSGDIVDVKSNYRLVNIGEVGISSDSNPILVTRDIKSCVAALFVTKECAAMLHLNLDNDVDYSKGLKDVSEFLKVHNENINRIQIFFGENTSQEKLEELRGLFTSNQFNVEVYQSYLDVYEGSIAYDFKHDKYYGVDNDGKFRNYLLGARNERDYMKEIYDDKEHGAL